MNTKTTSGLGQPQAFTRHSKPQPALAQPPKPRRTLCGFLALGLLLALVATQCQNTGSSANPSNPSKPIISDPPVTTIPVTVPRPEVFTIPEIQTQPLTPVQLRAEVAPVQLNRYQSCAGLLSQIQAAALDRIDEHGLHDNQERDPFFVDETLVEEFEFEPPKPSPTTTMPSRTPRTTRPPRRDSTQTDATVASFASPATTTAPAVPPRQQSRSEALADLAEELSIAPDFDAVASGAQPHSTTNVQVAGVDEADIVKTNGELIVGLSGQTLWLADVAAAAPRVVGELAVGGGDYLEMYLSGDRVFLLGESAVGVANADGSQRLGSNQRTAVVTEIDISDPRNPQAGRHLRLEGRYVSSRLTPDGQARVVVSSTPADEILFVSPARGQWSTGAAKLINQELIKQSGVEQWLPHYSLHNSAGQTLASDVLLECDRVFLPGHFAGFSQVSVVSFDANAPLAVGDATSVMAEGEVVYASAESLYVSHVVRDFTGFATQPSNAIQAETVVHKFAFGAAGQASYEGSGAVVGQPLNQFAFHEHDGHLFVATTVFSKRWESFVTSLEDVGDQLLINHKVGNLGKGEQIYAVRYVGDMAYVVTFRQTDPLYVIDLSNPSRLETKGELKITGYSAYLHPVGDDLLLGIGREATTSGQITGLKLSLFDVSDPANPRVADSLDFDGGSSDVEFDHRAFLWWEAEDLAVVPVKNDRSGFNGALGIRIRESQSQGGEPFHAIVLDQRITHDALLLEDYQGFCRWYRLPAEVSQADAITKICPSSATNTVLAAATPESYRCDQAEQFTAFELRQLATAFAGLAEASEDAGSLSLGGPKSARDLVQDLAAASDVSEYHFQVCTPQFNRLAPSILRSLVVGENLWTVSAELLQANDLNTLQRRAQLEIPG